MIIKNVPFYPNTPDNLHCYQAALKMILKYFLPKKNFSWRQLEKMTAMKKSKWTWATQSLINLHEMGFDIKDIDAFDIERFVKIGKDYLLEKYGQKVANAQEKMSDLDQERRLYKEYQKLNIHEERLPDLKDIFDLIGKHYLVGSNINTYKLDNLEGYSAHSVVIFGYDENYLYMHDPGLPPRKNREVNFKQFNKAWEYPNKEARNLIGFKLSKFL